MKAGIGQRGGKGVNESDLDKTSRPRSEAVEPREQRDSVILCQTKSLSLSPRGFLCLCRLLSPPLSLSLTFIYFYSPLSVLLHGRFHLLSHPLSSHSSCRYFIGHFHRTSNSEVILIQTFLDNLTGYI